MKEIKETEKAIQAGLEALGPEVSWTMDPIGPTYWEKDTVIEALRVAVEAMEKEKLFCKYHKDAIIYCNYCRKEAEAKGVKAVHDKLPQLVNEVYDKGRAEGKQEGINWCLETLNDLIKGILADKLKAQEKEDG